MLLAWFKDVVHCINEAGIDLGFVNSSCLSPRIYINCN